MSQAVLQHVPRKSTSQRTPSFAASRDGLLQRKCACGGTPGPTGECEACRKKKLQRESKSSALESRNDVGVPPIIHEVPNSPGHPLDSATRAFMESRFGHDFSQVRVHTDSLSAQSARALNALAYTVGQHIVFRDGRYAPESLAVRKLLAHELVHVVQQRTGVHLQDEIGREGDAYEVQANSVAASMSPDRLMRPGSKFSKNSQFERTAEPLPLDYRVIQFQKDDASGKPDHETRVGLDPTSNPAKGTMERAKLHAREQTRVTPVRKGVSGLLNTKARELAITDEATKKSITVQAFTGGHVEAKDCSIVSPGQGDEAAAPSGTYNIVDNPNPKKGHEEWYGLFKQDERMDDYFDDRDKERSGVRLHLGMLSYGCVTVVKCQPDATKKWKELHEMINDTKKDKLKFLQGPHWWNREAETTKYGTITIA